MVAFQKVDYVIGVALFVALTGSVVGVAVYEEDVLPDLLFDVAWATSDTTANAPSMSITGVGNTEETVALNLLNLTSVTFVLTVSSSATARVAAKNFQVEIRGPGLTAQSISGSLPQGQTSNAQGNTVFEVIPVPEVPALSASNLVEARALVNQTYASTLGMGDWVIRVSVTGGTAVDNPEVLTFNVAATATTYSAEVTVQTPEGPSTA